MLRLLLLISFLGPQQSRADELSTDKLRQKTLTDISTWANTIFYAPPAQEEQSMRGHVRSNERGFDSFKIPDQEAAGALIGTGSTVAMSMAIARHARKLILFDQSPDVALVHFAVYRTMFLISRSPEEFLARLASISFKPDDRLEDIRRRAILEEYSRRTLVTTIGKINQLIADGLIPQAAADYCKRFLISLATDPNGPATENGFFAFATGQKDFIHRLVDVHIISLKDQRFGLFTKAGFTHLRDLYRRNQVYLAVGNIYERHHWATLAEFARTAQVPITDIYTSNIAHMDFHPRFSELVRLVRKHIQSRLHIYHVAGRSTANFDFRTTTLTDSVSALCWGLLSRHKRD